jgi:hypothetical protein
MLRKIEFALKIRKLEALTFLPVDKVIKSFETLPESEIHKYIINYFESTWIGMLDRRLQTPCFSRIQDDLLRTTTNVDE